MKCIFHICGFKKQGRSLRIKPLIVVFMKTTNKLIVKVLKMQK
ncbi:hypothetical protein [Spiroplasma endosymbiont of Lariophagus distinguendus]|nr:hypothetical protein [Spiroplasma endosymbiont of Lariophagus distinguendus]